MRCQELLERKSLVLSIEKFNFGMNLPKPMTRANYNKMSHMIRDACKETAVETMNEAAHNLKKDDALTDVAISADGSWQRRGFSSLNGFVSAISMDSGKVLDIQPMSRFCKSCSVHEKLKNSDLVAYNSWKAKHTNCRVNYHGSSPNMEVEGTRTIFERSINNGLRYAELFSDGDSKTFPAIENVYMTCNEPRKVLKRECVGHVQKRVGNHLRKLKKRVHGLGGKGKLTEAIIDRLQNYYGIAIRSNKGDIAGMKTAIYASLFHVYSSQDNNWHAHCPKGEDSWCGYQRDESMGTNIYKPGIGLPKEVIKEIKPIFEDLSDNKLLEKCLDCKTQNQNECFNGYVWRRLPKDTYVGFDVFEFGLYDAVAVFNIGRKATLLT